MMRRKLLRRTQRQKGILSLQDLANIDKRSASAPRELQLAWQFDQVIPNHDGEDHEHWNAFYYPAGDALKSLLSLAALLQGQDAPYAERWEKDLWPESRFSNHRRKTGTVPIDVPILFCRRRPATRSGPPGYRFH